MIEIMVGGYLGSAKKTNSLGWRFEGSDRDLAFMLS